MAQARLVRAQAGSAVANAADGPQINGALDLTRQLYSANSIYPPPYGGAVWDSGIQQASASWELDFFGKNRAALDAALDRHVAGSPRARELLAALEIGKSVV